MDANSISSFNRTVVDGIPLMWGEPTTSASCRKVALWLPPFTQPKESVAPMLEGLRTNGFIAVSFDPFQHGERGTESSDELVARVFAPGNFRSGLWPIIGQTVLDARRVLDWVIEHVVAEPAAVVAGGLSMGGDVAVALAGVDDRIERVAAIVATPDWTRPGMRSFKEPYGLVEQGEPTAYAKWFYEQFDPYTHLERYTKHCAITFECAENDEHVPPDGALRFRDELRKMTLGTSPVRVNFHAGYGHSDGSEATFTQNSLDWLSDVR